MTETTPTPRALRRHHRRAHAGKSTLVNRLTGSKVSIVTQKVQTTRFPVRGIAIHEQSQIVLVDTPGIFKPRRRLDRAMVASAWGGAQDADAVVHLVDVAAEIAVAAREGSAADHRQIEDTRAIAENLKATGATAILALNKIDGVRRAPCSACRRSCSNWASIPRCS